MEKPKKKKLLLLIPEYIGNRKLSVCKIPTEYRGTGNKDFWYGIWRFWGKYSREMVFLTPDKTPCKTPSMDIYIDLLSINFNLLSVL